MYVSSIGMESRSSDTPIHFKFAFVSTGNNSRGGGGGWRTLRFVSSSPSSCTLPSFSRALGCRLEYFILDGNQMLGVQVESRKRIQLCILKHCILFDCCVTKMDSLYNIIISKCWQGYRRNKAMINAYLCIKAEQNYTPTERSIATCIGIEVPAAA